MVHVVARREVPVPAVRGGVVTPRQAQVLQLVADGCSYPEIAERLFIRRRSVQCHMDNIRFRLQARSTAHAVAVAIRKGWIT